MKANLFRLLCHCALVFGLVTQGECFPNAMKTYTYVDGSGNVYEIGSADTRTLEYKPVKPATSSSGTYDGGDGFSKALPEDTYRPLVDALETGVAAKEHHIAKRQMMSGMIMVSDGKQKITYVLAPRSAAMMTIESSLKTAKGDNPVKARYPAVKGHPVTTTGKELYIVGVADHSKLGAVVVSDTGHTYVIDGKSDWNAEGYFKKQVRVFGLKKIKYFSPEALKNANGEYSAGPAGEIQFIQMFACELVE